MIWRLFQRQPLEDHCLSQICWAAPFPMMLPATGLPPCVTFISSSAFSRALTIIQYYNNQVLFFSSNSNATPPMHIISIVTVLNCNHQVPNLSCCVNLWMIVCPKEEIAT
jgi:hypothetical protein